MNADSTSVCREDVDRAKAAGWTDEAIYDAITVCDADRAEHMMRDHLQQVTQAYWAAVEAAHG